MSRKYSLILLIGQISHRNYLLLGIKTTKHEKESYITVCMYVQPYRACTEQVQSVRCVFADILRHRLYHRQSVRRQRYRTSVLGYLRRHQRVVHHEAQDVQHRKAVGYSGRRNLFGSRQRSQQENQSRPHQNHRTRLYANRRTDNGSCQKAPYPVAGRKDRFGYRSPLPEQRRRPRYLSVRGVQHQNS